MKKRRINAAILSPSNRRTRIHDRGDPSQPGGPFTKGPADYQQPINGINWKNIPSDNYQLDYNIYCQRSNWWHGHGNGLVEGEQKCKVSRDSLQSVRCGASSIRNVLGSEYPWSVHLHICAFLRARKFAPIVLWGGAHPRWT